MVWVSNPERRGLLRRANSHGSAVSLVTFCHFSQSHDKAPNLTVFGKNLSEMK